MKVVVGDMTFEDDVRLSSASRTSDAWVADQHRAERVLKENMETFLNAAVKCYVARYGVKPERTTLEEF